MALTKEEKAKIVKEFGKDEKDTGSIEVQVAILTKGGLLMKVGQRKSKLNYLMKNDITKYREVINKLGLRK